MENGCLIIELKKKMGVSIIIFPAMDKNKIQKYHLF